MYFALYSFWVFNGSCTIFHSPSKFNGFLKSWGKKSFFFLVLFTTLTIMLTQSYREMIENNTFEQLLHWQANDKHILTRVGLPLALFLCHVHRLRCFYLRTTLCPRKIGEPTKQCGTFKKESRILWTLNRSYKWVVYPHAFPFFFQDIGVPTMFSMIPNMLPKFSMFYDRFSMKFLTCSLSS